MNTEYEMVAAFHRAFGVPLESKPTLHSAERVEVRAKWMTSEIIELMEAKTIADQADAYIDVIYFALGGLVEMGVKPAALFAIVNDANMRKLWTNGAPRFFPDGKIMKPFGWEAPDALIAEEIQRQSDAS